MQAGRLANKGCVIVGGTTGIGLETARLFLGQGARVLVAGRDDDKGAAADAELRALGPATFVGCDAAGEDEVERLFAAADQFLGRLDVLFQVAGISGRKYGDGPLHECTAAGWDAVMDNNLRSMFLCNRAAVRRMTVQAPDEVGLRGTLLNMASVLGWSASPRYFGTHAYAAAKSAILGYSRAIAAYYAPLGIRVNVLAPGLIDTPMSARPCGDPEIREYIRTKQPLTGGPGLPQDCASAALALCEPASHFITGAVLPVDGGWSVSEGQFPNRGAT
jgi:NAD(P)-dependent dehydrogenase (short-subunit alcohol dehydrogenase family)